MTNLRQMPQHEDGREEACWLWNIGRGQRHDRQLFRPAIRNRVCVQPRDYFERESRTNWLGPLANFTLRLCIGASALALLWLGWKGLAWLVDGVMR